MNHRCTLRFTLALAAMLGFAETPEVKAQEICSAAAVSDALDQLSCEADGAYVSPETAAEAISDRCIDAETERACRRCFRRSQGKLKSAFRALARIDLLDRSIIPRLREQLAVTAEDVCSGIDEELPPEDNEDFPPTNPEDPTQGDPGNGEQLPPPNFDNDAPFYPPFGDSGGWRRR